MRLCVIAFALAMSTTGVASASYCQNLNEKYSPEPRYITMRGVKKPVSLYWGSDPARAASALLMVVLRYALGYQNVRLRRGPHRLQDLTRTLPHYPNLKYKEIVLSLSSVWEPAPPPTWIPNHREESGLAGPRLQEFGTSFIPVRQNLYVHIANEYQEMPSCNMSAIHINFTDFNWLQLCGFINNHHKMKTTVYEVEMDNKTSSKDQAYADTHPLPLWYKELNRTDLFRLLRTSNHSFFFIDYNIWSGYSHVRAIRLPLSTLTSTLTCQQDLDNAIALRVGDVYLLKEFAPEIFHIAHNFTLSPDTLRLILELDSEENDVEEAACEWALKHDSVVKAWTQLYDPTRKEYRIYSFFCQDDPDSMKLVHLNNYIRDLIKLPSKIKVALRYYKGNCSDVNFVINKIDGEMSYEVSQRVIGVVLGDMKNLAGVTKTLRESDIPVMLYDATDVDVDATTSMWRTTGNSLHLALAVKYIMQNMRWSRVAVLSEPTEKARTFVRHLKDIGGLKLRDYIFNRNLAYQEAKQILEKLKSDDARIIFVNANYEAAATILLAAENLQMNASTDYAWMVREWQPNSLKFNIKHFSISFWCRHSTDVRGAKNWQSLIRDMDKFGLWPARSAALVEAVLTLVKGLDVVLTNLHVRDDTHNKLALKYFEERVNDSPIEGIIQNLTFKGHSVEEVLMFVEEWRGDRRELLARWRVNTRTRSVFVEHQRRAAYSADPPHDGALPCLVTSGDPYLPTCHTMLTIFLSVLFLLIGVVVSAHYTKSYFGKNGHYYKVKSKERGRILLSNYFVDRTTIEFRHELGVGKLASVRLAIMHTPRSLPRVVAAKELRDFKDEEEMLREAYTLTTLDHEHIISFIGVCIDDKPPIILLRVAFFGNLLHYLEARRHLVEVAVSKSEKELDKANEEVTHVSAQALTTLARQAASALAYLNIRGVIHRDLCASNCLVDGNRSLKLSDFKMARLSEESGIHDDSVDACWQRRPSAVPWMAPESLESNIFSPASDVWAFGILLIELITLGEHPFGNMSPELIKEFVTAGKKPPMPSCSSSQTNDLVKECWHFEPKQRIIASKLVTKLIERPTAIRPAIIGHHERLDSADSGFDDSPMSELLA